MQMHATTVRTKAFEVGTKVQSTGARWKLDPNDLFTDKVIAKTKYRSTFKYLVEWDSDGVVESFEVCRHFVHDLFRVIASRETDYEGLIIIRI